MSDDVVREAQELLGIVKAAPAPVPASGPVADAMTRLGIALPDPAPAAPPVDTGDPVHDAMVRLGIVKDCAR